MIDLYNDSFTEVVEKADKLPTKRLLIFYKKYRHLMYSDDDDLDIKLFAIKEILDNREHVER